MKSKSRFYTDTQGRTRYIGKKAVTESDNRLLRAPERGEKGQFITKDGKVIFVGGPSGGGGSSGGGSSFEDNIVAKFEEALQGAENSVRNQPKPDWYSDEEWQQKINKRLQNVTVGVGSANNLPGIELIIPGQEAKWRDYYVERARVDQLDNIYVTRLANIRR